MVNNINELYNKIMKDLKEVKSLGVKVMPGGGYAIGYNRDRIPDYEVGIIGALSLLYGEDTRYKLDVSIRQSMAIEGGFNGELLAKYKKHKEYYNLGRKIANDIYFSDVKLASQSRSKKSKLAALVAQMQNDNPGQELNNLDAVLDAIDDEPQEAFEVENVPAPMGIAEEQGPVAEIDDGFVVQPAGHFAEVNEENAIWINLEVGQDNNLNNNQ